MGFIRVSNNPFRQICMKTIFLIIAVFITAIGLPASAGERSPIISPEMGTNRSSKDIEVARRQGAATATKDIKAGVFRILYVGKPWSRGKPLVDEATGYRVQVVGGCTVTKAFATEVTAYNKTMRDWHAKAKEKEPPARQ
jgi:hypothetical protein